MERSLNLMFVHTPANGERDVQQRHQTEVSQPMGKGDTYMIVYIKASDTWTCTCCVH